MTELSYEPLTPTKFLERSAYVFADRCAVVEDDLRLTYAELWERVRRLAGALAANGVAPGDRVAVLAPNTHVLLEATFAVPAAGAVLVAMNTRLAPAELAYILDHAEARVLIYDHEFTDTTQRATTESAIRPLLIRSGGADDEYEGIVEGAGPLTRPVHDERSPLSINYTSGTTGRPKGVLYHHRGAYLQALAMALHTRLGPESSYLWTLPMFHCNGWCFPWAVTAAGATHVCLRGVDPPKVWELIRAERVTHLCGAPTVLGSLLHDPDAPTSAREPRLTACTGGAPPSPALLARAAEAGMDVIHLYGLTETYGPVVICQPQPDWEDLPTAELARLTARQGVGNVIAERLRVVNSEGGDLPADGRSVGEIAVRGNDLMLGYYRDDEATRRAVPDGWFRTGDLGVMHPDGYVQLVDRAKDVIISGGENIASVEVEQTLDGHPDVLESAVVARPDSHWGEVPVAFVTLREGAEVDDRDLIDYVRDRIAHFKAPKAVTFGPLPKTSTGKIQKTVLRDRAERGA
ncbi:MAG: long-chain-fatty-acid--CoA ligase [Streptosporangiales bacterium]|nr:long-chain-fatty-acid--CoA ligase [Streptosporangiales bacterium]